MNDEYVSIAIDYMEITSMSSVSKTWVKFRNTMLLNIFKNITKNWKKTYSYSNLVKTLYEYDAFREMQWVKTVALKLEEKPADIIGGVFYFEDHIVTLDLVKQIIEEFENSPNISEKFDIHPTTKLLVDLMELETAEALLLEFAYNYTGYGIYNDTRIWNAMKDIHSVSNDVMLYSMLLNLPEDEVKKAFNGFLFKSAILYDSGGSVNIQTNYYELYSFNCATVQDIEEKVFPQMVEVDLEKQDFQYIETSIDRTVNILKHALETKARGINILLWGNPGLGKTSLAYTIAKEAGFNIRTIGDISDRDMEEKSRSWRLSNLKIAQKLFTEEQNTVLLFDEIEDLFKTETNAAFSKAFLNRLIETTSVPIIWTTNSLYELGSPVLRRMTYNIECKIPPAPARRNIWKKYANEFQVNLSDKSFEVLDNFDISPALIKNAMRIAGTAMSENDDQDTFIKDVVSSLDTLVQYGNKREFETDNEVDYYDVSCINADTEMTKLTDRLVNAKSHAFSLCLYGVPGSGKSAWSKYLAKKMGKKVLFKRASDLQSMFVGQCEKNIAAAFQQAKEENKVLIIDEGDSFLQDRRSANRSWEISQVNELLSQMETHTQPFIITTNLMDNLDQASMRRFAFKVKFDYLEPKQSATLFQNYFGMPAPEHIGRMEHLSAGDFGNVKRQVEILGIDDANEILSMLQNEIDLKKENTTKIGFG